MCSGAEFGIIVFVIGEFIMESNIIEEKYKKLIDVAKRYMSTINDREHDINHMNDVVEYTKKILQHHSYD